MPKETFRNLKEDKKQRIINAALHEIAAQGYDKASVTRIVKDAGIATGSFYQYFEDLDDLFVYIGQEAGRLKTAYMQRALAEAGQHNLESCIRAMYLGGLRFGLEHEEYFKAAQGFMQIKDTALYRKMFANVEKSDLAVWLYQFVNKAIENGELHQGITPELFFNLTISINTTIVEHLIAARPSKEMNADDLAILCELGVQVVLHGMQNRNDCAPPQAAPPIHKKEK